MNGAQLHLLLNHLPVLGIAFAVPLTLAGLLLRKDDLSKAGLWTFLLAGISAIAANYTGDGAEHVVEHLPGVAESYIHAHEEAAEKALIAALLTGAGALGALIHAWRSGTLSRGICALVLAAGVPATGLMAWTAHLGGLVRHTELRGGAAAAVADAEGKGEADND